MVASESVLNGRQYRSLSDIERVFRPRQGSIGHVHISSFVEKIVSREGESCSIVQLLGC